MNRLSTQATGKMKPCQSPSRKPGVSGATAVVTCSAQAARLARSEEHTSELQSLMRISYAVFCLKNKNSKVNLYHTMERCLHTHIFYMRLPTQHLSST